MSARGPGPSASELEAAAAQLSAVDPVMAAIIEDVGGVAQLQDRRAGRPADHYGALIRSIVGQQVSTSAARAMFTKLNDRYGGRTPTPAEVLAEDPETLRAAGGLSRAKTAYLRSLAEHVVEGRLELERLDDLPDEQVLAELTAVKGIGPWSAQVFLMFHLDRPDIVAPGDLGIRKAIMQRYELAAMPTEAEVETIAEPWRPHRTLACQFLWASLRMTPV